MGTCYGEFLTVHIKIHWSCPLNSIPLVHTSYRFKCLNTCLRHNIHLFLYYTILYCVSVHLVILNIGLSKRLVKSQLILCFYNVYSNSTVNSLYVRTQVNQNTIIILLNVSQTPVFQILLWHKYLLEISSNSYYSAGFRNLWQQLNK